MHSLLHAGINKPCWKNVKIQCFWPDDIAMSSTQKVSWMCFALSWMYTESLLDVSSALSEWRTFFLSDVLNLVITFLLVMIIVNWSLITTEFLILNQSTKFLCKKFLIKQLNTMLWHEAIKLYGCDQSRNWLWWCKTLKLPALWKIFFYAVLVH